MPVAQRPRLGEVAGRRREHAPSALDRLDQHGGDLVATIGHQHGQRLDVVGRRLDDVGHQRAPTLPVRLDALGAGAAEVRSVVAALTADDDGAVGVAGKVVGEASELDRRVDRLGARSAEKDPGRRDRRQFCQTGRQLLGRRIRERLETGVGLEGLDLGGDGLGDVATTVPDVAVPEAGHGVDQLGAVGRPEQGALAPHDGHERRARRLGEGMQKAVDHRRERSRPWPSWVARRRPSDLQSSAGVGEDATIVTVVTWNVQGSAGLDVAGVADVIRGVAPDVFVVQEIGWWQSRRLARRLGMRRRWAFKHYGWPGPEGLAVLTPHRIAGSERFVLRRERWWDWRRRIAIRAEIDQAWRAVRRHQRPPVAPRRRRQSPAGSGDRRRRAPASCPDCR